MAKHQTTGRGQRGTLWHTAPHQNLTVSIYLPLEDLPLSKHFFLAIITSLAVYDTLNNDCTAHIQIKWPNDIYVEGKKIAGILLENKIVGSTLAHTVIGIGLNVNQTHFPADIMHKTTSIKLVAPDWDKSMLELFKIIRTNLKKYVSYLQNKQYAELLDLYNQKLFQRDQLRKYLLYNQEVNATIIGVKDDGLLQLKIDDKIHKFDLKDIVYQL